MGDDGMAGDAISARLRTALGSADLAAFAELLADNVTWGAPGDDDPGCRSRDEVLAWYRRGRDAGVRARVSELVVTGDRALVGLTVSGRPGAPAGAEEQRWQVLRIAGQRITDIRGFDDRDSAVAWSGIRP